MPAIPLAAGVWRGGKAKRHTHRHLSKKDPQPAPGAAFSRQEPTAKVTLYVHKCMICSVWRVCWMVVRGVNRNYFLAGEGHLTFRWLPRCSPLFIKLTAAGPSAGKPNAPCIGRRASSYPEKQRHVGRRLRRTCFKTECNWEHSSAEASQICKSSITASHDHIA